MGGSHRGPEPGLPSTEGPGLRGQQPAPRLRAWGRPTDSLAHARPSRRGSGVLAGHSYRYLLSPNAFLATRGRCPRQAALRGKARRHAEPAGRQAGGAAQREAPARAPADAARTGLREQGPRGGVSRRPREEGALERRRRPAEGGAEGGRRRQGAGRGEAGTRLRSGKAGARRWRDRPRSPPLFPTLLPPPTGWGSGEAPLARPPEPPCCRRLLPPLAVSPSVPVLCAPPSGPWMGKSSATRRPRGAALAPLPFGSCPDVPRPGSRGAGNGTGDPRSGPGRARRRGFRAPLRGARVTEGRSAAASPSPTRRPGNTRPFTPARRLRRKARCSRGGPGPPSAPRVRRALPGFPTLPLRKWCAALGEAEAALGAGVLPLGELLFTGEVGRALEGASPSGEASGRRGADSERSRPYTSGRRPGPDAGAPRGVSARGRRAQGSRLVL